MQKNTNFFPLKDLIYNFLVYHLIMKNLKNKYFINGRNFSCELKEPYLEDLIEIFLNKSSLKESKIAVAVNNQMIERYKWKKKKINFQDKIEIVDVEESEHIVSQMGPEPIIEMLKSDVDGIITGRALDIGL